MPNIPKRNMEPRLKKEHTPEELLEFLAESQAFVLETKRKGEVTRWSKTKK